ncbi:hybrid sensor histidine kinase/response regulator transcription factor [Flavobacterium seoulense]|uniref:histidine kinase n=1 Tax=Flavobacterium seoulense TaxID=1492738 RepID=A0A066WX01_9FLAO|nr:hybrid sensor histidine kinase/response regulator transcription factor [Flavobacterium seoulense]KDN55464.1 Response regulator receiver domain protein, putative transcriptional regulator [Flavobacterium seoulense]
MKRNFIIIFFYFIFTLSFAQPVGVLKRFTYDAKLSQSRILDIQQDEKGFIWLGTYIGLIRYDGTTFQNFEVLQRGKLNLLSNRVSGFKFDKNGRIWIKSEQDEIYYFDTQTLNYHSPLEIDSKKYSNTSFKQFRLMSSGRVWLFSEDKNVAVAVETDKKLKEISFDKTKLNGAKFKDVYEDATGTTWFLTTKGICKLKKNATAAEYFFFNMTRPSGKPYSYNSVMEIKEELWFAGVGGKLTRYSKQSSTFFDVQLSINADINRIEYVKGGKVLITTKTQGICYYDIKTAKIDAYNSKTLAGFPDSNIKYLGLTHSQYFWFETNAPGVYRFDLVTGKLKHLQTDTSDPAAIGVSRKTFLITAPDGNVWVQPRDGALAYWDQKQDKLLSIAHTIDESRDVVSDVMHAAAFDRLGNLWFCSYRQGLDLITFNKQKFSKLKLDLSSGRKKNNVRGLMTDKSGNLWLASRTDKITLFDSKKRKIGMLGADGSLSANSPGWGADIYHMLQDNRGRIWVGTRGNGLFCLFPTLKPFHYKVIHYKYDESNRYSISSDDIYRIFQSGSGKIYIATWGGGVNAVRESNKGIHFINYRNEWKNYPIKSADRVRSIVESKNQQLFFISSYKLFSFFDNKSSTTKVVFKEFDQVSGNDILDILVTSNNKLALGTNGKGVLLADLNKKEKLEFQYFEEEQIGFPIDGVVAMQEDKQGKIWLMGSNQIVRFDTDKKTYETFPELKSLIGNEIFSEATKSRLLSGEIVVGYSNGAVIFNPEKIKPFQYKPYLAITGFSVNNKELHEINPETPSNPDLLQEVRLEHDQNFFRVQFSALDYVKNENIVYRYKLEGIDKGWNYIKGGQSINYTNLSRGKYTLLISSTNSHNLWVDNQRSIEITILPSIWWTNLALIIYALLAIALFKFIRRTFSTIIKLRNDVQIEKQVSELKMKFFTDISHEIRTPLTMITAPLEKMLTDDEIQDSVKVQLQGIEKNSNRLLNLVNQILDLKRIENRKLEVKAIDLNEFAAKIVDNFREISLQNKIRLEVNSIVKNPVIWADPDSLDKILVNLISNAFKYCHKGDIIQIIIEESENQIVLKVSDNGPGINPVIQKRLFVRFSNYNENPNNPSTGIGLSIVKDLADKHGATVTINSEVGKGSTFELSFLKGYSHFTEDVDIVFEEFEDYLETDASETENEVTPTLSEEIKKGKTVGLVVEDDPELREFIVSVLEKEYKIHVAENGIDGHLKAASLNPDFIISDIMMPQMDGIEMLKLIRNNIATSHIPVILLSAKTAIESKLEGMEYGADEYIDKPFNVSYLKARVKNILEQRKRLQMLYSSGTISEIPGDEPLQISNQDHKFMFQVIKLVKDNVSKTDFSVEELGKLMCMSRASFFNKLKDLTGVSPVVFIRDIRLNEAAEMLKKEDLLIKEICFEVGFSDLKYFGKCFKAKFNYTPAEYRRLYR